MEDINKHTIAILHAITLLGRTSIFEMNSIEEQGLNAENSSDKQAMDSWTKKFYEDLKIILGEDHIILSNFKDEWNV